MRGGSATCVELMLLAAVIGWAATAAAQRTPLDEALAAYAEGALDIALERFEAALRRPGNNRDQLGRIHHHLGIIRASFGETEAARVHFAIDLALDPSRPAPSELPPPLRALFERERGARAGRRLTVRLEAPAHADAGTEMEVQAGAADAPPGVVARVRLALIMGERALWEGEAPASGVVRVPIGTGRAGDLVLTAAALDTYGGVLATERTTVRRTIPAAAVAAQVEAGTGAGSEPLDAPPRDPTHLGAPARVPPGDDRDHEESSMLESPWLWLAVAAVAAGATAGILFATRDERWIVDGPVVR